LNILYSSRIEPGKGYFELLEILFLLKKNKVDFLVTIIGDGSLKSQILKKIESLNLKKNVKFTGKLESKKVEKYLENTDLFISISSFGILENNNIEAASKGVPIIALDNRFVSKKYKKYFYTIKDFNFKKTINFIIRFSKSIELRKKYSSMSENFFNKYIVSWDQRIKKELDLLNNAYEKKFGD
jgi:glycosyltransferase involved in cell wall biosynthesis